MMPARDFSALFTDRAGSRYIRRRVDGPQHQADGAADRISPGHIQQQQTRSNLFDKCLADCVCCLSLSLIRVNEFLLLLTHFTLVYVCRLLLCIGEHRMQGPVQSLLE